MNQEHGHLILGFLFCCLAFVAGCATSSTVAPSTAVPAEPPPVVEAPFELPGPLGQIFAPGQVRELVPGGAIDWSGKTVWARGTGVLDPGNSNTAQARLMAERAATVVAQRNLLEIIKGVRVDSDTRIQDLMAEDDTVYQRVEGVVKGARQRSPARYDSLGGTVEVELECDIYGEVGVESAVAPLPAAGPQSGDVGTGGLSRPAIEFLRRYSGLVLDAGKAVLKPALFPKLYDESGTLLLDPRELLHAGAFETYTVQYVGTLDQVLARREFGQPLVLRVREVRGKFGTDIVLARGDAGELKAMEDALEFLMSTGRVLVTLAP